MNRSRSNSLSSPIETAAETNNFYPFSDSHRDCLESDFLLTSQRTLIETILDSEKDEALHSPAFI